MLDNEKTVDKAEIAEIAEAITKVKENSTERERDQAFILGVIRGFELSGDIEKLTRSNAPAM